MSDQLSLFGGEGGPAQAVRPAKGRKPGGLRKRFKLSFAILPDAAVAAEISRFGIWVDRQYGIHGEPLRADRLHITLHVLGEYEEHPIEPIRWTAREFVLINSHVGKTYHEHVGRWPLLA